MTLKQLHATNASKLADWLLSDRVDRLSLVDKILIEREKETPTYLKTVKLSKFHSTQALLEKCEDMCQGFISLLIAGGSAEYEYSSPDPKQKVKQQDLKAYQQKTVRGLLARYLDNQYAQDRIRQWTEEEEKKERYK